VKSGIEPLSVATRTATQRRGYNGAHFAVYAAIAR
jgi:hypothetical protein